VGVIGKGVRIGLAQKGNKKGKTPGGEGAKKTAGAWKGRQYSQRGVDAVVNVCRVQMASPYSPLRVTISEKKKKKGGLTTTVHGMKGGGLERVEMEGRGRSEDG